MNWRILKYLLPSARREEEREMRRELESLAAMAKPGELGNLTLVEENARETWRWPWLWDTAGDVRYGIRTLARSKGFTAAAVLTLALGIGANTAIFSVMNSTVLKPLPFPNAERLVLIWQTFGSPPGNENILSAPNIWDLRRETTQSLDAIAFFDSGGRGYNIAPDDGGDPEQVSGLRVSANFFQVLNAPPMMGRWFTEAEEQASASHVVILSFGLWKRRYDSDARILGKSIRIDGAPYQVVGVMPPDFSWQFWSDPRELWVPVGYTKTDFGRGNNSFMVIGRMKEGVTLARAREDVGAAAGRIAQLYPADDAGMGAALEQLSSVGVNGFRKTMLTLMAAVGLVLLIACVNVANLMLARGASRRKEFAIRRALGAPSWRIARQMLIESLILAFCGGVAGLSFAWAASRAFFVLFSDEAQLPMRHVAVPELDGSVLAFALALSCLTGIVFGLIPALGVSRKDLNPPLRDGGRESAAKGKGGRVRHVLVACEAALAVIILSGAGLMVASLWQLLGVDPGFDPKNVLTMFVSVPQEAIYTGPPGLPMLCRDLEQHVGSLPGVVSVSAAAHLPFRGNAGRGFQIEGRPPADANHMPGGRFSVACPGYFRTMGIPVLRGREFTAEDTLNSPGVVVINDAMARKFWPKEDPVGKAIRFEGADGPRLTVVGVVGDVRFEALDSPPRPQMMRPYTQAGWPVMNVVVRAQGTPGAFIRPVQAALKRFLPDRPVTGVQTMERIVKDSTGWRRTPMLLLLAFSVAALLLAGVGITGVVGYSVTQRTQEIGIRMALGARRSNVLALVLRGSMTWVGIGLVVGILGSIGTGRMLGSLLYGVQTTDPVVLGSVAGILLAVAVGASLLPARRAANLDPIRALRQD